MTLLAVKGQERENNWPRRLRNFDKEGMGMVQDSEISVRKQQISEKMEEKISPIKSPIAATIIFGELE